MLLEPQVLCAQGLVLRAQPCHFIEHVTYPRVTVARWLRQRHLRTAISVTVTNAIQTSITDTTKP
jgi:hypothetical protein